MNETSADEQYRIWLYHLIVRLEQDPDLAQEVQRDPVAYLTETGFPREMIDDLLGRSYGEVSEAESDCTATTCWTSNCPASCIFTTFDFHCGPPPKLPPFPDPNPPVVP